MKTERKIMKNEEKDTHITHVLANRKEKLKEFKY